jgi:repressor LexA
LERNGYIRRDPTKPRAIEILDQTFQTLRCDVASIPIIGQVAAGSPLLAVENVDGYFPILTEYLHNKETFVLSVKGDSMINIGIFDGDYLIVESQETAANGDVAVVLVDDSATVKRFYKENGGIRLQPENDLMEPIIIQNPSDVMIIGKVIGLYRKNII